MAMRADNSAHLIAATHRRSEQTLARARKALAELTDSGQPVTISTVAARAGVSRAWLYTQTDLRQQIQARAAPPSPTPPAASTPASDASLRQRLSLALERVRELTDENDALRRQIAGLHGQLRATQLTGHAPLTDTVHDTNTQIKTPTDQDHLR